MVDEAWSGPSVEPGHCACVSYSRAMNERTAHTCASVAVPVMTRSRKKIHVVSLSMRLPRSHIGAAVAPHKARA
jgi:hypothetical protein